MFSFEGRLKGFANNRWLIFVVSMWIQSFAGTGYLFGSISPVIKSAMGYNQRQVALLGVTKDLGGAIGLIAGSLCEVLPIWGILLIGVVQNIVGYGLVWLAVIGFLPSLPLWLLCIAIFVGSNGETYFNTATLVSSVQNFPMSRGPIVGILKGFAGLSGAILSQIYNLFNFSSKSSLILMIVVGPSALILALMFLVRPIRGGHRQIRSSDGLSFTFVYGVCLLLAAYLMGILVLEDLASLSQSLFTVLTVILLSILLSPITIPILMAFSSEKKQSTTEEKLLSEPQIQETIRSESKPEIVLSEVENDSEDELLTLSLSKRRIVQLQAKVIHIQAATEGALKVKKTRGPHIGEDFTLWQALRKADFLLMFAALVLAAGTGVTIIDNLGQMCESLGYSNTSIFVSMISIWNFLGRVGGGYLSELVVRKYAYPRPVSMAVVQAIMAFGLFYYAMGWTGSIYVVTVLVGLGYGAHWAIVPAAVSDLFGLKSFGALYSFLTLSCPAGSLIFSGVIASGIYDYEAQKQASIRMPLPTPNPILGDESFTCIGTICYSITCAILSALCSVAFVLSMIVVYRTRTVYTQLYKNTSL